MPRVAACWCVCAMLGVMPSVDAYAQQATARGDSASAAPASPRSGRLHGTVRDDRGAVLAGAVVSAVGPTTVYAVSDASGRFLLRDVPAGPYLIRVHLRGYVAAPARIIQIAANTERSWNVALVRAHAADSPPVLVAGVGGFDEAPVAAAADEPNDDPPLSDVAWRLRHLKRNVLKEHESPLIIDGDDDSFFEDSLEGLSLAVNTPIRVAALFADMRINGQLNLLTTTSFDRPQELFSLSTGAPRGVAYLSLVSPIADGEWMLRGTISEGDLASWIIAGSYRRTEPGAHQYEAGLSFSMQRYMGGNAEALASLRDAGRQVGSLYAFDTWSLNPRITVAYGAKYANYDYLASPALVSPRVSVGVRPFGRDALRVTTTLSHRESAPGAEEFLPSSIGLWLPPERTFSPLREGGELRPERVDHVEIEADRAVVGGLVIGVRAFRQRVVDQGATLFGMRTIDTPASLGHYYVASAGDVSARGWGLTVTQNLPADTRVSVDYAQSDANWRRSSPDSDLLAGRADSLLRGDERLHDLTASVQSQFAVTSTRLLLVYKMSNAFAAGAPSHAPVTAARFAVQVNQPLPFLRFTSADWEMLIAVRNLFHEELLDGSLYDELLVVRPPKRVLGGVTVRF